MTQVGDENIDAVVTINEKYSNRIIRALGDGRFEPKETKMNFATDLLVHEHDLIERFLVIIQEAANALESKPDFSLEPFDQTVEFIQTFADKFHHGKEEVILFKYMEQKGMSVDDGPIGVMLYEHTVARGFTDGMANAINKVRSGDNSAIPVLIKNASNYAELLSQHIAKENNILYPMGNRIFSDEEQESLRLEFYVKNENLGKGTHERFQQLVVELETFFKITV